MTVTVETKLLDLRPELIRNKLGSKSKVCLLNSKDIFKAIRDKQVIVMACNTRIKHVIPGIMRAAEELDSIVAFELAKTEGNLDGGYTGMTPEVFFETIVEYAENNGFSKPFFIHGDHITTKNTSREELESSRILIEAELKAGYTSFAIDSSFNELHYNIRITTELAQPIVQAGLGLEVEVGEIKHTGQESAITTVEEATVFINSLWNSKVKPDLLAINNGSKHGNYLEGEKIFIDLDRTREIYEAIKDKGVCIAQHGITGTPLHLVGKFADCGIRKGNVGTEWQNIAHRGLPEDLMQQMKKWSAENKKDIKFATKVFKKKIDSISEKESKNIEEMAYQTACEFITAFRAEKLASKFKDKLFK
ncbi:MAG: class II fructose-bisphosphate aldolase [candidate division Zixibacteria bacterium]|nr:class II fructose-bisphosphate aldolase [candidate division Zixibacteria bacterium]